ncbi:MAG TPA: hypothetical protein VHZ49_21560 [Methylomirabilota bacterium]|jgi:hypothetical protein|nr:hypothetical protein [Methylomirabilota bacterium]
MIASMVRDAPLKRSVAIGLMLLALDLDLEMPGLSKGPADPADIGTRCAVMAGRADRAYLPCAQEAPGSSAVIGGREGGVVDQLRRERSGEPHGAQRYPVRRR